jgi:H+/Cl- antiporter ClcA
MPLSKRSTPAFQAYGALFRWTLLACIVGAFAGSAAALFLWALARVTEYRETHLWIIWGLPVAGFGVGWVYHHFGAKVEGGNNLVLDEIHEPSATIPLRMTPLILVATLLSHLFGGSVGREGTAIQMGASLADQLPGPLKLGPEARRVLLMAGMSAGFGAVFGTPLAATVFGLEVLAIGQFRYGALFPCLMGAIIGNEVTLAWGISHGHYAVDLIPRLTWGGTFVSLAAGALFGLTGAAFARMTHSVQALFKRTVRYAPLRPALGGAIVAIAVALIGTRYIGLGDPVVAESFAGPVKPWDFAMKMVFTALTLGSGFKGGEVTPLFFMGSTLGNGLSQWLPLPSSLLAAMGFVGVFAGASNTPIACTFLAVELFGSEVGVYAALACVASYLFSGNAGIYASQRSGHVKHEMQA